MNREVLITLVAKDINELTIMAKGLEEMEMIPQAYLDLARQKVEGMSFNLKQLQEIEVARRKRAKLKPVLNSPFDSPSCSETESSEPIKNTDLEDKSPHKSVSDINEVKPHDPKSRFNFPGDGFNWEEELSFAQNALEDLDQRVSTQIEASRGYLREEYEKAVSISIDFENFLNHKLQLNPHHLRTLAIMMSEYSRLVSQRLANRVERMTTSDQDRVRTLDTEACELIAQSTVIYERYETYRNELLSTQKVKVLTDVTPDSLTTAIAEPVIAPGEPTQEVVAPVVPLPKDSSPENVPPLVSSQEEPSQAVLSHEKPLKEVLEQEETTHSEEVIAETKNEEAPEVLAEPTQEVKPEPAVPEEPTVPEEPVVPEESIYVEPKPEVKREPLETSNPTPEFESTEDDQAKEDNVETASIPEPAPVENVLDKNEEQMRSTLADQLGQEKHSLQDSYKNDQRSVNTNLQKISNLKAISFNDRFRFQRELFGGNGELLGNTFDKLEKFTTLEDALNYLRNKFNWSEDNRVVADFYVYLQRRY